MALAGLSGCLRWPEEEIVPYVSRPEGRDPGVAVRYASAIEIGGVTHGILATTFDGRPTKLEGNPDHPVSGGAADLFVQASILDLYDPDRSRSLRHGDGQPDDLGRGLPPLRGSRRRRSWRSAPAARASPSSPSRRAVSGDSACGARTLHAALPACDLARLRGDRERQRGTRARSSTSARPAMTPAVRPGRRRTSSSRSTADLLWDASEDDGRAPHARLRPRPAARRRHRCDGHERGSMSIEPHHEQSPAPNADHRAATNVAQMIAAFARTMLADRLTGDASLDRFADTPAMSVPWSRRTVREPVDLIVEDLEAHRAHGVVMPRAPRQPAARPHARAPHQRSASATPVRVR